MKRLLLSVARAETIETFGLRLIILGLIAEAVLIAYALSIEPLPASLDKLLSAMFTLAIAMGVWIEHIGVNAKAAPRNLTIAQQKRIATKMASFNGLRAVLGAVPPSVTNTDVLEQLLSALRMADVDAFINLNGVEASVSPTGASNRGTMLTKGFPNGIAMIFTTGNERAEAFSTALANALIDEKLAATVVGGRDEERMAWRLREGAAAGLTRNDKQFEPVIVVVGDKP
jgi:hypothetical protein